MAFEGASILDPVKYGVLWQKVQDMDKRLTALEQALDRRFECAEQIVGKQFEKTEEAGDERHKSVSDRLDKLENKVDLLVAGSNRNQGGISAATTILTLLAGVAGYLLNLLTSHKGP